MLSYQKKTSWNWVAVGMLVDFCLRFYAGAGVSPLGSLGMLAAAAIDLVLPKLGIKTAPVWGAGPPKQFAVFVGVVFSAVIVVLKFFDQWQVRGSPPALQSSVFRPLFCPLCSRQA